VDAVVSRVHDAQIIIIIVLRLSESALHPFPRSGVRSRVGRNQFVAETKTGRRVAQAACTVLTWLRGYSAGPPRRVSSFAAQYAMATTHEAGLVQPPASNRLPVCSFICDMTSAREQTSP